MVTFSSCIKPFFDLLYFISKVDETIYILKMAGPWLLASSLILNNAKEASLKSRGDIQQVTKNINTIDQGKTTTGGGSCTTSNHQLRIKDEYDVRFFNSLHDYVLFYST